MWPAVKRQPAQGLMVWWVSLHKEGGLDVTGRGPSTFQQNKAVAARADLGDTTQL